MVLKAGNSTLTLDVNGRLSLRLNGQHQWQADALCVLHYYDRQHPRAQQVRVPWDDTRAFGTMGTLSLSARSTLAIRQIDERKAEVDVVCDTIHMRLTLRIEMDPAGEGFDVSVAPEGVREEHSRLYRLLGVEVLPEFGAARTGELGYLTLPNWFGCQTFFDRAYPREVWQTIYSSNDRGRTTVTRRSSASPAPRARSAVWCRPGTRTHSSSAAGTGRRRRPTARIHTWCGAGRRRTTWSPGPGSAIPLCARPWPPGRGLRVRRRPVPQVPAGRARRPALGGFFHCHSNPGNFLRTCAIGRYFLDRPVPMLGVALHGSHLCCESVGAGNRERLLEMLDLGLAPQYEVCMRPSPAFGIPAYAGKAEMLAEAYRFTFGAEGYMTRLGMLDIDGRWELAPGVSRTRYSNGTEVTVNRGDRAFDGLAAGAFQITPSARKAGR
ncbi:MAG: DUF5696 domain-containing protein [bacterium]